MEEMSMSINFQFNFELERKMYKRNKYNILMMKLTWPDDRNEILVKNEKNDQILSVP